MKHLSRLQNKILAIFQKLYVPKLKFILLL